MIVLYSSTHGRWKIGDFGLTKNATSQGLRTSPHGRGTECYIAPELLREPQSAFNKKTDIWSLGCIFFELCTGEKLFNNNWALMVYALSKVKPDISRSLSTLYEPAREAIRLIIDDTIHLDVSKRSSVENLLQATACIRETVANFISSRPTCLNPGNLTDKFVHAQCFLSNPYEETSQILKPPVERGLWKWVIKITQLIFTLIAFSLSIALLSIPLYDRALYITFFNVLATFFSQVSWAYIFFYSLAIEDDRTRMVLRLAMGVLNIILYLSAALAMSTLNVFSSCSDQIFVHGNLLFGGNESRCRMAQACVSFLWLGMLRA